MADVINLRGVIEEDFVNYKVPSLFLITTKCNWKCCSEGNFDKSVCQNNSLIQGTEIKNYKLESIYNAYINNLITKAIVVGGLEPFEQFDEIKSLIDYFRWNNCFDDFVIYTGYYPDEIIDELNCLQKYANIIIKFGRYVPGQESHFDDILGINLASDNQYGERIS